MAISLYDPFASSRRFSTSEQWVGQNEIAGDPLPEQLKVTTRQTRISAANGISEVSYKTNYSGI